MIISQMVTCPHCRASMPEGTPHRCTSAILASEKRTRADAEAAQAAEARGPVRMLPTPAPRGPVAYDPAHPDRDPRVLQGTIEQRTERELLQELVGLVKGGQQ